MVNLEDDIYKKLVKDANDNKQLVRIAWAVVALVSFIILFVFWGKPMIDIDIRRRQADLECEIAIVQAENAVRVREIESSGMEMDDYLEWLDIRERNR